MYMYVLYGKQRYDKWPSICWHLFTNLDLWAEIELTTSDQGKPVAFEKMDEKKLIIEEEKKTWCKRTQN